MKSDEKKSKFMKSFTESSHVVKVGKWIKTEDGLGAV